MDACVTRLVVFSLTCLVFVHSFLISGPRTVTKILGPTYISQYGSWGRPEFCAHGAFATGYNQKIEPKQNDNDDTSLNAIELNCTVLDGNYFGGTVSSTEGLFGAWGKEESCQRDSNTQQFLTGYRIQVEGDQHGGDDTAANYIEFKCRAFSGEMETAKQLSWGVGHGFWGSFSSWNECLKNTAICGIQTRVEDDQHGGDDTALNDVKLFCCSL